jgi:hypothetical protein
MNDHLPVSAACGPREGRVFHWTGNNSERDRRKAATELHRLMLRLEQEGCPYHIIAHSHGGNVVLQSLRVSVQKGDLLGNLRSWATIGTPFLHHKARLHDPWLGIPLSFGLISLYFVVRWMADFMRYGDPLGADALVATISGAALFCISVLTNATTYSVLCAAFRSWTTHRDLTYSRTALRRYGQRYLGIWSPDDEAISSLRTLVAEFRGKIMPRMRRIESTPRGVLKPLRHLIQIYNIALVGLYNTVFCDTVDRLIWERTVFKSLGVDVGGLAVAEVSPGPVPDVCHQPVPVTVQDDLRAVADSYANQLISRVRRELGVAALDSSDVSILVTRCGSHMAGKELIHSTYFYCDAVKNLLCSHIGKHIDEPARDVLNDRPSARVPKQPLEQADDSA